jgi:diguanylate cyclase (GGDEF)-like protein
MDDKIIVVDDDQALSRLVQKELQRLGYKTAVAANGAQAIEWVANNPVKLLLVDYRLPDMTGDKVIKTMTQRGYSFPFIVVTGQGDEETAVEMMKLGARDYLVKDSTFIDRLPQAIERTLEQFAIEQKLAEAEEDVKRYSRRVQALYTVGQAVSRSLDLDRLLTQSLKATLDVMNTDVGGIYISDLQAGSLTLKAHSGLSQDCIGSIALMNLDEEEIKLAMECHQPVLELEKVFTKTNLKTVTAAMKKEGLQAYVTVPLWSRGTPLGSLVIADHREHHFSPDELDLLSAIGTEIAVGIENALLLQRTKELSLTDELTGLYNRRHFYETLESELYRTLRNGRPFSLVMLDLDGFKEYNDRFGHSLGDSILQSFAQTLHSTLRKSDTSFRYGGDEFAIILAATDANRAKQVIDRIRAKWLKNPEAHHPTLETPLGFSAGIAQFPENAETADALVFLADSALYYAKREGGYRATLVSDLTAIKSDILSTATLDQVYALAATVDARDPYTYGHSARVADIAQTLAKAIGLPEKELADLYAASLLHDVGKVGIPDAVLTKPDLLTAEEWEIIKKHSAEGARIVGYVKGLAALVPVILHHHEWYDGTGYPAGLKGEEIPLTARIISLADAYDTMTTSRPYREVVSHEEAREELKRHSGTQFDPELVEAFCRAMAQGITN